MLSDLLGAGVPDGKRPDGVVGQLFGALHCHQETAVLLLHLWRPVLVTFSLKEQWAPQMMLETLFPTDRTFLKPWGRWLTRPFSTRFVIMTTTLTFCSHTILQKSSVLDMRGPCAAMYNLGFLKPWTKHTATNLLLFCFPKRYQRQIHCFLTLLIKITFHFNISGSVKVCNTLIYYSILSPFNKP